MSDENKILFLHVRKTAGTSARVALKNIFDLQKECPIRSQMEFSSKVEAPDRRSYLEGFDFIAGHFDKIVPLVSDSFSTVIFLRHPIDRIISAYNHIQNDTRDPLHKLAQDKSLRECLTLQGLEEEMQNSQTRYLVGNAGYSYDDIDNPTRLKVAFDYLEQIVFVGITEEFSLSLALFSISAGRPIIQSVPELNREITKGGIDKYSVIVDHQYILQKNTLDAQLYDFARALFNKRVTEMTLQLYSTQLAMTADSPPAGKISELSFTPYQYDTAGTMITDCLDESASGVLATFALNQTAVEYYPNTARFHYRKGVALRLLGAPASAVISLRRAVELNPSRSQFRHALASTLTELGYYEDAIKCLRPEIESQSFKVKTEYSSLCHYTQAKPDMFASVMPNCEVVLSDIILSDKQSMIVQWEPTGAPVRCVLPKSFENRPLMWRRLLLIQSLFSAMRGKNPSNNILEFPFALSDGIREGKGNVCFSTSVPGNLMVPDPTFLLENGYRNLKNWAAENWAPFFDRKSMVYWRGAVTGFPLSESLEDILELPRINVCENTRDNILFDTSITHLGSYESNVELQQALLDRNIYSKMEPVTKNMQFKYMLDIDGVTSSWPGLMSKLICGGVVIKLRGNPPFKQWYYDQLVDGENIFFADDTDAVVRIVRFLEESPEQAEAIGKAGRALALSLEPESSLNSSVIEIGKFAQLKH